MKKGVVMWFSNQRGYGFIESEQKQYFVHFRSLKQEGFKTLEPGQKVQFETKEDKKGISAVDVEIID